jgi:hypothetical protein
MACQEQGFDGCSASGFCHVDQAVSFVAVPPPREGVAPCYQWSGNGARWLGASIYLSLHDGNTPVLEPMTGKIQQPRAPPVKLNAT